MSKFKMSTFTFNNRHNRLNNNIGCYYYIIATTGKEANVRKINNAKQKCSFRAYVT